MVSQERVKVAAAAQLTVEHHRRLPRALLIQSHVILSILDKFLLMLTLVTQ